MGPQIIYPPQRNYPETNYLINGGFDVAQLQNAGTLTTISDAAYGPDGWKVFGENASVQHRRYKRGDSGSSFTGLTSQAYSRFSKITSAGQIAFAQILEAVDTYPLIGRTVSGQIKLRGESSRTLKAGLLEWQGTADSLTSDIVSSWGDPPTWATNYSLINSASLSAGTSMGTLSVSGTPSTSCNNLLFVVWSAADVTASTGYIEAAEAGLYEGDALRPWLPMPFQKELDRCLRRVEKSYPLDTAPGTTAAEYSGDGRFRGITPVSDGFFIGINLRFQVPKRTTPTITVYSNVTGAAGKIRNESDVPADVDGVAQSPGPNGASIGGSSSIVADKFYTGQWVANANL